LSFQRIQPPQQSDAIARFLDHCHRKTYPAKATIIRQGEAATELFYIIKGSVTVMLEDDEGKEIVLAYLNPGDFFGEIGLFNEHSNRSALVRARSSTDVAHITYDNPRTFLGQCARFQPPAHA